MAPRREPKGAAHPKDEFMLTHPRSRMSFLLGGTCSSKMSFPIFARYSTSRTVRELSGEGPWTPSFLSYFPSVLLEPLRLTMLQTESFDYTTLQDFCQ